MAKNKIYIAIAVGLFFLYMTNHNKENFGGSSWFPYAQMKDIRNTTDFSYKNYVNPISMANMRMTGDLQDPIFAYFDVGNRFRDPKEVDSLFGGIQEQTDLHKIMKDSNERRYLNEHKELLYRGGNA